MKIRDKYKSKERLLEVFTKVCGVKLNEEKLSEDKKEKSSLFILEAKANTYKAVDSVPVDDQQASAPVSASGEGAK